MRDGTEMSFDELRDETAAAVDESGKSQAAVARELDMHRSAVSRAVKESGPRVQKIQRRVLRHLTPYRIDRRVRFKAHREE
jgi:predicted transcriptional regulator